MDFTITNKNGEVICAENKPVYDGDQRTSAPEEVQGRDIRPFLELDYRAVSIPGIQLIEYHMHVKEEIHLHTTEPEPLPSLFFMQQGTIRSKFHYQDTPCHFHSGQHTMLFNALCAEDTCLQKQDNLRLLMINFHPDHFLQLADAGNPVMEKMACSIVTRRPTPLKPNAVQPISAKMHGIVAEIQGCTYSGGLRQLFMQSKVMELLVLQCAQLEKAGEAQEKNYRLSQADLPKVYLARDILITDIQNPPSLSSLARLSGLNEFKLKSGFRKVFANSVFGYLSDHRLELGKTQVLKKSKSLTEIAYETGYASLAHFSNAFKKKYGISPLKLRA